MVDAHDAFEALPASPVSTARPDMVLTLYIEAAGIASGAALV